MAGYLGVIYRWAAEDQAPSPERDLVRMVEVVVEGIAVPGAVSSAVPGAVGHGSR